MWSLLVPKFVRPKMQAFSDLVRFLCGPFFIRRNEEASIEPRVGLVFEDWLSEYTAFLIKWSIYRDMRII